MNICHFIKLIINHQLQHKHQLNIKLMFMVIYKDQLSLKFIFIDLKTLAKQKAYQCRVLLMRHHSRSKLIILQETLGNLTQVKYLQVDNGFYRVNIQ